jgi:hypothetical protein
MIIKVGFETDIHRAIFFSKPGKNSKSLENVSHVIDIEVDLLVGIAPIFVDGKRAPLKPVLEKKFCLAIDVLEQIGFREDPRAFGDHPSLGRFLGKGRRIGPSF